MTEYLDILNDRNEKIGTASRAETHAKGLLHRVSHCWVVSRKKDGDWVWFQQRAHAKADFPDFYDIAVGGHVAAGEKPLEAAVREIREEIGLAVSPEELRYLGAFRDDILLPGFDDRELAEVFLYLHPAPAFRLGEEVDRMIRLPRESLLRKAEEPVTAYTAAGEAIIIQPEEWCRHGGEIERFLLPALEKKETGAG